MKGVLKILAAVIAMTPIYANSGGNPEYVNFPEGYEKAFTKYATINRANQTQVAKLYANETAIASYKENQKGDSGSVLVMEIYSTKTDADGKPVPGDDGIFVIDSLAAVAVMENRDNWDDAFSAEDRTGNWGFAVYNPDGTEKSNDLNCVQCHTPLSGQDYLFTYQKLVDFVKNH
ncbi:cytochrome P460 family protein [Nitrosomonas sp.]|uniref:cytochrome P460 family protein n=1 Tax=Nitrosomonas sp. TaxID=42353 RepID=UPI001D58D262|nr:cytochrome P460 family protein [Nitrosomonas sp.]MCB1948366.1 cytochrome P460 family protein [Nitrosomonas sp.]